MEYRGSRVEITGIFFIIFGIIGFLTPFMNTFIFSIFYKRFLFRFFLFFSFLYFFLLFIVVGYFINYNFLFMFFLGLSCVRYGVRFEKCILSNLLFIRIYTTMHTYGTGFYFLEIIPIIYNLITASPSFFQIMEYRFTGMEITSLFIVFRFQIFFPAPTSFTFYLLFLVIFHYNILYLVYFLFFYFIVFIII